MYIVSWRQINSKFEHEKAFNSKAEAEKFLVKVQSKDDLDGKPRMYQRIKAGEKRSEK